METRPEIEITAGGLEQAVYNLEEGLGDVERLIEEMRRKATEEETRLGSSRFLRYATAGTLGEAKSLAHTFRAKMLLMKAQVIRVASYFDTRGHVLTAETAGALASAYGRVIEILTRYNAAVYFGRSSTLRYDTVKPFDEERRDVLERGFELVVYPRFSRPPAFGKHSAEQRISDIEDGHGGRSLRVESRVERTVVEPTPFADAGQVAKDVARLRKALDAAAEVQSSIDLGAESQGRNLRYGDEVTFERLVPPAVSFRTHMTHALAALNAITARIEGTFSMLNDGDVAAELAELQTRFQDLASWGQRHVLDFNTNAPFDERSFDLLPGDFTTKLRFVAPPRLPTTRPVRAEFGRGTGHGGRSIRPMTSDGLLSLVRVEGTNSSRRDVAIRNMELVDDLSLHAITSIAGYVSRNDDRAAIMNAGLSQMRIRMTQGAGTGYGEPVTTSDMLRMVAYLSSNSDRAFGLHEEHGPRGRPRPRRHLQDGHLREHQPGTGEHHQCRSGRAGAPGPFHDLRDLGPGSRHLGGALPADGPHEHERAPDRRGRPQHGPPLGHLAGAGGEARKSREQLLRPDADGQQGARRDVPWRAREAVGPGATPGGVRL